MSIAKLLKSIVKNLFTFLVGAIIGIIIIILFVLPAALEKAGDKVGLGIIALAPALLIIYGALGIIIGGFSAIIIYNIVKFVLKRKRIKI